MNKYLSIIILNVNGLNAPIKRHRVAEWIRKHGLHIFCLQEPTSEKKDLHRLKVKGWKKISQANGWEKKAGVAILILEKRDFKTKAIKRHRRTLHNTQGKNAPRRRKYCKHICTQHRNTEVYKENLGGLQERYTQQHSYTGDFNTPL